MAKKKGVLVVVDNVFATPLLQKPLKHGADLVMYSATKHMDGQGRVLGGAILGKRSHCDKFIKPFIRNTGPSLSPFNAWVLLKGLETLDLRINQQVKNSELLVKYLEKQKLVSEIMYPYYKKSKSFKLAKSQMTAGGNILAFRLKSKSNNSTRCFSFLNNLKLIKISNNLGDNKTLIAHPYTTTHHKLNEKEKRCLRITKNLIRLSIGLEDSDDLINDFDNSFRKINRGN